MSNYTNVYVNVSQSQYDKIKKAAQSGRPVSIKLSHSDLEGDNILAVTSAQKINS